jgi:hypothetical protein
MSRCPSDRPYDHGFGCRQPRRLEPMTMDPIEPVMRVSAFGTRPAEASRDDRSDGAYALLPADISSSTVQLGALRSFRGDSGERSESPALPPIRVRCPVGQGLPGAYEDHPWEATRQGEREDLRVPGERGQPDVARDHGEAPGFERGGSRRSRRRGRRLRPRQEGVG